jgi:hypothetical protein
MLPGQQIDKDRVQLHSGHVVEPEHISGQHIATGAHASYGGPTLITDGISEIGQGHLGGLVPLMAKSSLEFQPPQHFTVTNPVGSLAEFPVGSLIGACCI